MYLPMHLCLFTSDGGPVGHSHTGGGSRRSTRHRRRINRQKADERHREIDVDGVVERDTECVGNINEFSASDGYQSGLDVCERAGYLDDDTKTTTYRNLDTHIPMATLARLDTCPPAFPCDTSCAMTCEIALDRFFCDFSPLCLCWVVAVCRSGRFASCRGECADVLEECEAEVFDLTAIVSPKPHNTVVKETPPFAHCHSVCPPRTTGAGR